MRHAMTDATVISHALDVAADTAIAACGGDARAAVRTLIVANNYLEAEVQRLTEAVSLGFTRGLNAKGKEHAVLPRSKADPASWRDDTDRRFPHWVDLEPPEDGFSEAVEDKIVRFLEPFLGTYDVYVDLRGQELFMRYCFARKQDAAAFHVAFAGAAAKSHFKAAG
jgi:hypothetical protein